MSNHTKTILPIRCRGGGYLRSSRIPSEVFGGPHDPGTGKTGYRGQNLEAGNGFYIAELGMGTLLGGLPRGTRLYVTNPKTGAEVLVTKEDIGLGR